MGASAWHLGGTSKTSFAKLNWWRRGTKFDQFISVVHILRVLLGQTGWRVSIQHPQIGAVFNFVSFGGTLGFVLHICLHGNSVRFQNTFLGLARWCSSGWTPWTSSSASRPRPMGTGASSPSKTHSGGGFSLEYSRGMSHRWYFNFWAFSSCFIVNFTGTAIQCCCVVLRCRHTSPYIQVEVHEFARSTYGKFCVHFAFGLGMTACILRDMCRVVYGLALFRFC